MCHFFRAENGRYEVEVSKKSTGSFVVFLALYATLFVFSVSNYCEKVLAKDFLEIYVGSVQMCLSITIAAQGLIFGGMKTKVRTKPSKKREIFPKLPFLDHGFRMQRRFARLPAALGRKRRDIREEDPKMVRFRHRDEDFLRFGRKCLRLRLVVFLGRSYDEHVALFCNRIG